MTITVLRQKDFFNFVLPEKGSGQYQILMDDGEPAATIRSVGGQCVVSLAPEYSFLNTAADKTSMEVTEGTTVAIQSDLSKKHIYIMFEASEKGKSIYSKYFISQDGKYEIGRAPSSDVVYPSQWVSSMHATLTVDETGVWIEDHNTPNGTYVNGNKIHGKQSIFDGDLIYIVGLKIIYANHILAINQPVGLKVSSRLRKVAVQKSLPAARSSHENSKIARSFYRSPRFINQIEPKEIRIDPPPAPIEIQTMPLAYLLGPSITMGLASILTAIFTIINANGDIFRIMPTLIMSVSMLTMTVLWPILTKRYEKKKRIEAESKRVESYSAYIEEKQNEIRDTISQQEKVLNSDYISVNEIADRVFSVDRSLWERSPWHTDYLRIRLGIGSKKMIGSILCPEKKFTVNKDELEERMYQIADKDYRLRNVPISVQLNEVITGVIGDQASLKNIIDSIIIQLATLHSYDECKLYVIFDPAQMNHWKYLYDLPHCWDDKHENRNVITTVNEANIALQKLSQIFEERKEESKLSSKKEYDKRYVLIILDRTIASSNAIIKSILETKDYLGISVVAAYGELKYLPRNCTQIIEVAPNAGRVFNRFADTGAYTDFTPDVCSVDTKKFGKTLANIYSETAESAYELPEMLTFLEMMKVGRVEQLNSLDRWNQHTASQEINAELGVNEQGEPFVLNLHERSHGPHGLIAGMTGSGKSELIMTMILSLAVNYHPYDVAFILIDFKGGGMAKAFEKLPHTVGIITNLDGNEINRSLASINSELRNRQMAFAAASNATGESNIDIYKYQQLYRSGIVKQPIPHLLIVSDEFAELKSQYPDFMAQLISAARIGRSLGVHLILATQKPSGVVDDQIWSNSKFRICLKVQDRGDSQDVIKRPDAAELNTTGRFYLQVGYNELFETGQSAWSGAPYFPSEYAESRADENVVVIDNLGHQVLSIAPEKASAIAVHTGKQIDAAVRYLRRIAKEQNIALMPLWMPALPALLEIKTIEDNEDYTHSVLAVCGLIDAPGEQAQYPLTIDFVRGGNVLIYGISGSGRTTFLSTMIYQLITHYKPDKLNIHIVDCGSGSLNVFSEAPHIGYSLGVADASGVDSMFKMLQREVRKRKEYFSKVGGDYSTYLEGNRWDLPAVIIFINNYSAFYEIYDEKEDVMCSLTREGEKYGVFFVIAGGNAGSVRNRISQNFKQNYVLQMNDRFDYSAILGNMGGVYPAEKAGRGVLKHAQAGYEFQVAYVHDSNDSARFVYFSETVKQLLEKNGGVKSNNLETHGLPVNYEELGKYYNKANSRSGIPVGLDSDTDEPLMLKFTSDALVPVLSVDNFYIGFVRQLVKLLSENQVETVVIDAEAKLAIQQNEKVQCLNEVSGLNPGVMALVDEMIARFKRKKSGEVKEEEFSPRVLVINDFAAMEKFLDDKTRQQFYDLLENGIGLGMMTLLCGNPGSISPFSAKGWYRKRLSHTTGLWIGPGYDQQNVFTMARPYRDSDINSDGCYLINDGMLQYGRRMIDPSEQRRA